MARQFSQRFISAFLAAALALSLSTNIGHTGEGGEGGGAEDVNNFNIGANAGARRGAPKAGVKRGRAGPQKWEMRDRNGKRLYKIEKSRITGKFYVSKYGKDPRSGKNKPTATKSLSEKKMKKVSSFDGRNTTVRIRLDGRVRTITVRGNVTG